MSNHVTEESDPFERAVALHEAGRYVDAVEIYRRILDAEGEDAVVLELLGSALASLADHVEALRMLDRSIVLDPGSATAWLHRGTVKESLGDRDGSLADLRASIELDPTSSFAAASLGTALLAHGLIDEAWSVVARSIEADPGSVPLRSLRVDLAMRRGRLLEAEIGLESLLAELPEDPTALSLLARLRAMQGRPVEAVRAARRAFESSPDRPEARLNLATALASTGESAESREALALVEGTGSDSLPRRDRERIAAMAELALGRPECAADRMRRWTAVEANDAEAWAVLASALRLGGELEDSLFAARRADELSPNVLGFVVELGRVLLERGDADAAIAKFEQAARLGGGTAATTLELINALKRRGLVGRAIRVADDAVSQGAVDPELGMSRVMLLHDAGRHREAVEQGESITARERLDSAHLSNHLFGLNYPDHVDESRLTRTHARLASRIPAVERGAWQVDRQERRALRVGFVSADLKAHSVTWFLRPLLRHLDRTRCETVAYSNTRATDMVSELLRRETCTWRVIAGRSDEVVTDEILADRIDVLIDLGGHTADNRLGVFRRSPAPVQMTWLGYPNTTGVPEIGWRIVDGLTDPSGADTDAAEALLRMAAPFLCFDADMMALDIPDRPGRPVVFGSFNNTAKLSDRCLELWGRVIGAVPGSTLLLKSRAFEDPEFRGPTLDRLERFGIDRSRVELVGFSHGRGEHHLAYARIDIALDTFPYHGTTTTCEALWNGVPVVSRIGDVHRARVGKTLLQAVGLPELACGDDDSFVQAAVSLAADTRRRQSLHAELRDRMRRSPLCDGPGFARRFEAAIRHAWRSWCRGEAPTGVFLTEDS